MTSSRLILIFLGFIFIIIVVLTSSKIAGGLRSRFGGFFPSLNTTTINDEISPTPTITEETPTPTLTPSQKQTKVTSTPNASTPATGPTAVMWFILGGSFLSGLSLRRFSSKE